MKKSILLLIFIAVLASVFFVFSELRGVIGRNLPSFLKSQSGPVSPDILYLTSPVYNFSGVIEKIENNNLTVVKNYSPSPPPPFTNPAGASKILSMPSKKLLYTIALDAKTTILKLSAPVNSLSKSTTKSLTVKDLKIGNYVDISSNTDLRLLEIPLFKATSVVVRSTIADVTAKIVQVRKDSLIVKIFNKFISGQENPTFNPEKNYEILITSDTQIIKAVISPSPGEMKMPFEKLSLADLEKDQQIFIRIDTDKISGNKIPALEIRPLIVSPVSPFITTSLATQSAKKLK